MTARRGAGPVERLRALLKEQPLRARPWSGAEPPRRILAIRLHALGDTLITLPYLNALRRRLPGARLDFLTRVEVAEIPRCVRLFDDVVEIGGGRDPRAIALHALRLVPRLRRRRYDLVLDLQRSRVSRTVRHLLRPRAWTEFDRTSPLLAGERTRLTIEAAGVGPLDVRPDLELVEPESGTRPLRAAGWDGAGELVVLNPAGSLSGRAWPLDAWARFAELWSAERGGSPWYVVLGLPHMAGPAGRLKARLGGRMLDLAGRTTAAEAFALVRRAALVLSEDSGLMHMAWVAGAPTLGLFGASKGAWARPHGSYADWIRACVLADGSCLGKGCRAGPPSCLERLPPEAVVARARALLAGPGREPRRIHLDGVTFAPPLAPAP